MSITLQTSVKDSDKFLSHSGDRVGYEWPFLSLEELNPGKEKAGHTTGKE